jgi:hypothetical protein
MIILVLTYLYAYRHPMPQLIGGGSTMLVAAALAIVTLKRAPLRLTGCKQTHAIWG